MPKKKIPPKIKKTLFIYLKKLFNYFLKKFKYILGDEIAKSSGKDLSYKTMKKKYRRLRITLRRRRNEFSSPKFLTDALLATTSWPTTCRRLST